MRSLTEDLRISRKPRQSLIRLRALIGIAFGVLAPAGCGRDTLATQPTADVSELYWALKLDHRAVTLSRATPYDTIRLTATPENVRGEPLSGLGLATFSSSDLTRVRVSPDGVVQALAAGNGIPVVATLQTGNATHVDTAFITITVGVAPSPLARLSIQPVPPDSAKLAQGVGKTLTAVAFSEAGTTIPNVAVDFRSSDPIIAGFCTAICGERGIALVGGRSTALRGNLPGSVTIVASATVYGVTRADTLSYTLGLPISRTILVQPASRAGTATASGFVASEVRVGAGAAVTWSWQQGSPATDVVFDDPTAVAELTTGGVLAGALTGSGNIAAPDPTVCNSSDPATLAARLRACLRGRLFRVPGIYRYQSTLTGATGQIVVVDESAP